MTTQCVRVCFVWIAEQTVTPSPLTLTEWFLKPKWSIYYAVRVESLNIIEVIISF